MYGMLTCRIVGCLCFLAVAYSVQAGCHVKDRPKTKVIYIGDADLTIAFGERLNLTCKKKFYDMIVRTECTKSGFTRPSPSCKLVKCPEIENLANGVLTYSPDRGFNSSAIISCKPGYIYTGHHMRTCQRSGNWTGQVGNCTPESSVRCDPLTAFDHVLLTPANYSYSYGSTVIIRCEQGYFYNGTRSVTCLANGLWSGVIQRCNPVFCVKPSLRILHGQQSSCNPCVYGTSLNVACHEGYFYTGTPLYCDNSGSWKGTRGICTKVRCKEPNATKGGRVEPIGYDPGDYAEIVCDEGYNLVGPSMLVCQMDGQWNSSGLACAGSHEKDASMIYVVVLACSAAGIVLILVIFGAIMSWRKYRNSTRFNREGTEEGNMYYHLNNTNVQHIEMQKTDTFSRKQEMSFMFRNSIRTTPHFTKKDEDQQIDLDSGYIDLSFVNKNNGDETFVSNGFEDQSIIGEHADLDQVFDVTNHGDTILLQGKGGVGKSATVQKLLRKWANGQWAQDYDLVFSIDLHCINFKDRRNYSLRGFLERFSTFEIKLPDNWSNNDHKKLLIFIDAIDEFPRLKHDFENIKQVMESAKAGVREWLINILRRDVLGESTLIFTSRHFHGLNSFRISRVVEVEGLTDESIMTLVERHVEENQQSRVKNLFQHNRVLLSVASITFFCMTLCRALASERGDPSKNLKTYTRIACFLIMSFLNRDLNEVNDEDDENEPLLQNNACLAPLAKLAYTAMFEEGPHYCQTKFVFRKEDLNNAGVTGRSFLDAKRSGLLLCKRFEEQGNDDEARGEEKFEFVHQSLQELLSMAFLLCDTSDTKENTLQKVFESSQFKMAQKYAFGLAFDKESEIINHIMTSVSGQESIPDSKPFLISTMEKNIDTVESMNRRKTYHIIQVIYESQDRGLASKIVQNTFGENGVVKFRDTRITAIDINAIFFMLHSSEHIYKLSLERIDMDMATLKHLGLHLKNDEVLTDISFEGTDLSEGGFAALKDISQNVTLRRLCLKSTLINDADMLDLSDYLKSNTSLRELSIDRNNYGGDGLGHIANAIGYNNTLNLLKLDSSKTVLNNLYQLTNAFRENKTLKVVLQITPERLGQVKSVLESLPVAHDRIICEEM